MPRIRFILDSGAQISCLTAGSLFLLRDQGSVDVPRVQARRNKVRLFDTNGVGYNYFPIALRSLNTLGLDSI